MNRNYSNAYSCTQFYQNLKLKSFITGEHDPKSHADSNNTFNVF